MSYTNGFHDLGLEHESPMIMAQTRFWMLSFWVLGGKLLVTLVDLNCNAIRPQSVTGNCRTRLASIPRPLASAGHSRLLLGESGKAIYIRALCRTHIKDQPGSLQDGRGQYKWKRCDQQDYGWTCTLLLDTHCAKYALCWPE